MWQTLNTRSILAHVKMPHAFQIALGLFEHAECKHLRECLIGRPEVQGEPSKANDLTGIEDVHSQRRLIEAVYTEIEVNWRGLSFSVASANHEGDLYLLVTPVKTDHLHVPPLLTVEASVLWNREGSVGRQGDRLSLRNAQETVELFATAPFSGQNLGSLSGTSATIVLDETVGLCTGGPRSLEEIREVMGNARETRDARLRDYGEGETEELAGAVHSALGWTGVFDPGSEEVVTTVSRVWASRNAGAVIFCWDSFFAATMAAALGDASLARSNIEAITRPIDELGYIPNVLNARGSATFGQSQPPVGSCAVRYAAEASGEADFAAPFLGRLLRWNRWWVDHRLRDGYLCWGSTREGVRIGGGYEEGPTGTLQGAKFESGLDNSPTFDEAEYDEQSGLMLQADVGLMALYIRDCLDLAVLSQQAGRDSEAAELRERAETFAARLDTLWSEEHGIYLNYDLARQAFSPRLSPCNFYPLMTGKVPAARARRMIEEHLLNPAEFWGDFVLPSISRNDPAYADQSYWRGRVWAPMNYLVYLSLKAAGENNAARELANKGNQLILKNWRERGFIGENYNADTGLTGERANSDPFNPWGALLGLVGLLEAGAVPPLPELK